MKIGPFEILSRGALESLREDTRLLKRQIEDIGWMRIGTEATDSRSLIGVTMDEVMLRCRRAWIHNPLAGHSVRLKTAFVFSQGITEPKAEDDRVQEIVTEFWNDPDNKLSFTSPQAQMLLSNKLQYDGQLFLALFVNRVTGDTKVRVLDPFTIKDIVRHPDDNMRTLFYRQTVTDASYNYDTGTVDTRWTAGTKFRYLQDVDVADPDIYGVPEDKKGWTPDTAVYVFHVKTNCDILDKWGMPELWRALDWLNAHRDMASDTATLIRSQATWAWKKKIQGTAAQVNAFKGAMQMVQNQSITRPVTGAVQIENQNVELTPIDTPTGGANIMEIGLRQMRLVIAAAVGIFEHYFGDAGNANLASTKAMELPMLKDFLARQILWVGVYDKVLEVTKREKIRAGVLDGSVTVNPVSNRFVIDTPVDLKTDIDFPPILEQDLNQTAQAYSTAKDSKLIPRDTAARQFMMSAEINNVDDEIKKLEKEWAQEDEEREEEKEMFGPGGLEQWMKGGAPKPGAKQPPKKPVSEAVGGRAKTFTLARKVKTLRRGMKAYENALAGAFERFRVKLPEGVKVIGPPGAKRVHLPNVDERIELLLEDMQKLARAFFPEAVRIGAGFVYSHVQAGVPEKMKEANEEAYLEDRLAWNARFVQQSLGPALKDAIEHAALGEFADEAKATEALLKKLGAFESRVRQYAGAYWTVEERAVKVFGKTFDLEVNFIGPEDDANCEDCAQAVAGGPYPISEAPVPGEDTVCRGNCRHALQIIGQAVTAV